MNHFHLLFGMMIDCLCWSARDATDASRRISGMREKVATELRMIYDEFIPPNVVDDHKPKSPGTSPASRGPTSGVK